jgi:hypothetical protein
MLRFLVLVACFMMTANCGGPPAPGPAAEKIRKIKTVAVLQLPVRDLSPAEQDMILSSTANRLQRRYKVDVLFGRSLGRAVWGALDKVSEEAVRTFRNTLQDAKSAIARLQFGRSFDLLNKAHTYLPYCGVWLDKDALVELFVLTGLAHVSQEHIDKAEAEFRQAISFRPDLELEGFKPLPAQADAFEQAKRQLTSGNPHQVAFTSDPPGATVVIDGIKRGTTPLPGAKLFPGMHFIRMELAGYAAWTINLPDSVPPESISARLFPVFKDHEVEDLADNALSSDELGASERRQLRAIADSLSADAIVLMALGRDGKSVQLASRLYIVAPEELTRPISLSIGSSPAAWKVTIKNLVKTFKQIGRKHKKLKKRKNRKKKNKTKKRKKGHKR